MIDTASLRINIIDLATSGKLSTHVVNDGSVKEIANNLPLPSKKRKRMMEEQFDYDEQFEIPDHWQWFKLGEISSYGDTPQKVMALNAKPDTWILELEDVESGGKLLKKSRIKDKKSVGEKTSFYSGQVLYSKLRPYLKKVLVADEDGISTPEIISFDVYSGINPNYIVYCLTNSYVDKAINKRSYGIKMPRVDAAFMANLPIPIPPVEEQNRIVKTVSDAMNAIDAIDALQLKYSADLNVLKSKIIDAGIQGKLTERFPGDGDAEELLKEAVISDSIFDENPFDIPDNWKWIKLGDVMNIERGGSPRPIKSFITDCPTGVNWIKIGDVAKDGKYIQQTKEKIIPEGVKKSREVFPGDFLLTNSMSFGRPYISNIYGCIHDGWLLLRNTFEVFDLDFLYWFLSSQYAYSQFTKKASGATVDNLNKDKVADACVALPPLAEQKRIVEQIETMLSFCN